MKKEKYQEYVNEMKKAIEESKFDEEFGHVIADGILCDFLKELGYNELVMLFDMVDKWYA